MATKTKRVQPFHISGVTIPKATGVDLLGVTVQPGFTTVITGFQVKSPGTAWNEATGLKLQDGDGAIFATILKAALAGSDALINPWTSNVTLGAAWAAGSTAGTKLEIVPYGSTETTGTNPTITVWGYRF
jgi:hypothetical protein